MIDFTSLTPEQKEIWDFAFQAGTEAADNDDAWSEAYNEGFADGEEEGYNAGINSYIVEEQIEEARIEGYNQGYEKGFNYEQQRIHSVIQMQMRWAEEQNKGRDYMFWKGVKEILTPINFEPWSEERWQEELEKDGF
jgi:hypothetical protein